MISLVAVGTVIGVVRAEPELMVDADISLSDMPAPLAVEDVVADTTTVWEVKDGLVLEPPVSICVILVTLEGPEPVVV